MFRDSLAQVHFQRFELPRYLRADINQLFGLESTVRHDVEFHIGNGCRNGQQLSSRMQREEFPLNSNANDNDYDGCRRPILPLTAAPFYQSTFRDEACVADQFGAPIRSVLQ